MSARTRRIVTAALLGLALLVMIIAGVQITLAIERFEQARIAAEHGDVNAIEPWMTIPYIARTYHVPESYILHQLNITDPQTVRHVTLSTLAARLHISTTDLIHDVQEAILNYRQSHPGPTPGTSLVRAISPPGSQGARATKVAPRSLAATKSTFVDWITNLSPRRRTSWRMPLGATLVARPTGRAAAL